MKNCEPRNPPSTVIIFPDPRSLLKVCIPANMINVKTDDTKKEAVVGKAETEVRTVINTTKLLIEN